VQISVILGMVACYAALLFYTAPLLTLAALALLALVGSVIRRLRRPIEAYALRMRADEEVASDPRDPAFPPPLEAGGATDAAIERLRRREPRVPPLARRQRRALDTIPR